MCKIMLALNARRPHLPTVAGIMTADRDRDGWGFAEASPSAMRVRRWLRVSDAGLDSPRRQLPGLAPYYNSEGPADVEPMAWVAHARLATGPVAIGNTHPFVSGNVALVHNGVVQDRADRAAECVSTCDSELLLRAYVRHNVWEHPEAIDAAMHDVRGSFACVAISPHGVDVWRNKCPLWARELYGLKNALLISTDPGHSAAMAQRIGCGMSIAWLLPAMTMMRFSLDGHLRGQWSFTDPLPPPLPEKPNHGGWAGMPPRAWDHDDAVAKWMASSDRIVRHVDGGTVYERARDKREGKRTRK